MLQISYKIMAVTLVGTAILLAIGFAVGIPFNFFM